MKLRLTELAVAWSMVCCVVWAMELPDKDHDKYNYFVVEMDTSESSEPLHRFIERFVGDYKFEHQARGLDDHFVFSIEKKHPHNEFLGNWNSDHHMHIKRTDEFADVYDELIGRSGLKSINMLVPKKLEKRMPVQIVEPSDVLEKRLDIVDSSQKPLKEVSEKLGINDPTFIEQWHLVNTFYPGNDVNVSGLWYEGITGKGVVSALVDDGLDYESADLKANFNGSGSWDFNDNNPLPFPRLFDDYHGTRCAGEIAAVKNDVCGVGVAYESQVSGIRILSKKVTGEDEAAAMIYGLDVNDIYSCSWGPYDDGRTVSEPEAIVKKAMIHGVQEGRGKKGALYIFASGNGGRHEDSCNFDGYTNSIYSITVGAIDYKGLHPTYSETCSAVMVVTYSSGSGEHIHTTDIKKQCSAEHGGTSAAAPLAAGIYALVLHVNPNLTWRDVQYVSVLSAVPINEEDGNYQITALNRKYSHVYGYGKIDSYTMVHFAKEWKNVKPQAWYYSDVNNVNARIKISPEQKSSRITAKITVSEDDLRVSNVERVEHVTVIVTIRAAFRGGVGARLISPHGVVSELATFRDEDSSAGGFDNWTFMSIAHWGETGIGEWKLEVFGNGRSNDITLENWQLRLFGESIDAEKAEQYELTKDYAAVRRDRLESEKEKVETSSSIAITSEVASSTPEMEATPTASSTTPLPTSSTLSESPEPSEIDDSADEGKNKQYTSDHTGQYFMALAVVGFLAVLVLMKYHRTPGASRRRRRREEYEFDIIPGEDDSSDDDSSRPDSLNFDSQDESSFDRERDRETDRLFDELHEGNIKDYAPDQEMFQIEDDDRPLLQTDDNEAHSPADKSDTRTTPSDSPESS